VAESSGPRALPSLWSCGRVDCVVSAAAADNAAAAAAAVAVAAVAAVGTAVDSGIDSREPLLTRQIESDAHTLMAL
jgi:uncharacterized protein with GYD domain